MSSVDIEGSGTMHKETLRWGYAMHVSECLTTIPKKKEMIMRIITLHVKG